MILLLGSYLQNLERFVDDAFVIVLPDKIGYIVNLNKFDQNV